MVCIASDANYKNKNRIKIKPKIKNKINIKIRNNRHGKYGGFAPRKFPQFVQNLKNSVERLWNPVDKRKFPLGYVGAASGRPAVNIFPFRIGLREYAGRNCADEQCSPLRCFLRCDSKKSTTHIIIGGALKSLYTLSMACLRSAIRSSAFSRPQERRIRSAPTPAASSCSSVI